jgi:hypothetical protein
LIYVTARFGTFLIDRPESLLKVVSSSLPITGKPRHGGAFTPQMRRSALVDNRHQAGSED